jgi:secreted PhoX family phosphatase
MAVSRRRFIGQATGAAIGATVSVSLFDRALVGGATNVISEGRYGPLGPPDVHGIRLPNGFTSRLLATARQTVPGTNFSWRSDADGGACFPRHDGGWVYVVNHERSNGTGGASALRFDVQGTVIDAYSILSGTTRNCSGGPTPWNTYLSCEENGPAGQVWECDPFTPSQGVVRPLLGSFNHEAAVVDPATGDVYLTEDQYVGRLYRFTPTVPGKLDAGVLKAAAVDLSNISTETAPVEWHPVRSDAPDRSPVTTEFRGGEGAWIHRGRLLFSTKNDKRVWELDLATSRLRLIHDCLAHPNLALDDVDAVVVHEHTGDIYVAEDPGNMQLGLIEERPGTTAVSTFLQFVGHETSEVTGIAFDPSGSRLYVSSQRGVDGAGNGLTFEIGGPFGGLIGNVRVPLAGLQHAERRPSGSGGS